MNLLALMSDYLLSSFQSLFPEVNVPASAIEVTRSTQEKFGHYQCNSAMKLSGLVNMKGRELAVLWVEALQRQAPENIFAKLDIAGPGFINITLSSDYLIHCLYQMLKSEKLGIKLPQPQKIVVDFSSPNTAKEMHVGHLRTTIIGDSIARLLEFLGHDVLRLNHIGDWGTSFGMLIAYLKSYAKGVLTGEEATDLTHLVAWYKLAKKHFDEDPQFKKHAQLEVVALQSGDENSLHAWRIICNISRVAYQEIYDLLDVYLIERGESFYNPYLLGLVSDLEKNGVVTVSDGAKCIFLPGFKNRDGEALPFIIQKSDGGFNYATTDMAALFHRVKIEKAKRIIYVTDAGQSNHFQMLFAAGGIAGFYHPDEVVLNHVGLGMVLGPDGKKFKTRSGETEKLIDLLNAAISKAEEILKNRGVEDSENTAKILGINAIKYADLSSHRTQDYVFSYDKMLAFEGNTAAFLMYSYVRINSIKRKVGVPVDELLKNPEIRLHHPSEIELALQLCQFSEVIEQVAIDLFLHRLCDYLYQLANRFNAFFRDCRVEGDEAEHSRLILCELTSLVLYCGMTILGLQVVSKM